MLFQSKTKPTKRLARTLIFAAVSFVLLLISIFLIFSSISKHLIEKYDVEYLGRNVKMDWVYVNPVTGFAHFSNLKIYESNSLPTLAVADSVFFSTKGLSVNIAMLKLLSRTFEISKLKLNRPKGIIIQKRKEFNFSDLISKFSTQKTDTTRSPFSLSILNVEIKNGEFRYIEKLIPINYFVKEVNINSNGIPWNSDSITTSFSFLSGAGSGNVNGNFAYNLKSMCYNLSFVVKKFDINILEQYLHELANFGTLRATLDANLQSIGNFNDAEDVTNKGVLVVNDFHFGKNQNDDYLSFAKLTLAVNEVNPKKRIYDYDSILVSQPYIKYELFDNLDNYQAMFGEGGANISRVKADSERFNLILKIADYLKLLRKNFFQSDFKINKVVIEKGTLKFDDYSQNEKFSIVANPLYLYADSIYKTRNRVDIYLKSGVQPYGIMSASLSINPKYSSDFELNYNLKGLPVSLFNPYIVTHTSFPLDRGTLELNGSWTVLNGKIKSNNHLLVIDPRVGERVKNKDFDWIPLHLIMYLIREQGNVIDYQIPITGNLKNPKFRLHDVVTDVLRNIFIKPSTKPYQSLVKRTEAKIEKSLTIKWGMRQKHLLAEQRMFVNRIVDNLLKNPDASIEVYPILYTEKEMEHIAFFEAKKKFFLQQKGKNGQTLSPSDSAKVNKLSVKDSLFVEYLNQQTKGTLLFTTQEKCNAFIGEANIKAKLKQLSSERENAFMQHFKQNGVDARVKILPADSIVPYNGFSNYKIDYIGQLPESLFDAFRQMDEINTQSLRKKYEKKRVKVKSEVIAN